MPESPQTINVVVEDGLSDELEDDDVRVVSGAEADVNRAAKAGSVPDETPASVEAGWAVEVSDQTPAKMLDPFEDVDLDATAENEAQLGGLAMAVAWLGGAARTTGNWARTVALPSPRSSPGQSMDDVEVEDGMT